MHLAFHGHVGREQLKPHVVFCFCDGEHFGIFQQLLGEFFGHRALRCGVQGERGNTGGLHAFIQPGHTIAGCARHENERLDDQDGDHSERKKAERQAVEPSRRGAGFSSLRYGRVRRFGHALEVA